VRKFISALAFGALLLPDYGFTLGMGEIEVNSALNQQLNARIELLSSVPEDAETLIVKLASREQFSRAGLDRPYSLTSLKFKPYVENGQLYIKVTTPKPVREPFLNFLIEIDWPKGHLLREYTILLDPPVFMGQVDTGSSRPAVSQARTTAPAPVQSTAQTGRPAVATSTAGGFRSAAGTTPPPVAAPTQAAPTQVAPATSQSQTFVPVTTQQQTRHSTPSGGYRVQAGDTAWSLADSMRPDQSVSIQQMLLAMLRTNPEVFINENVNGLKKGYILRIPDRAEITSISAEEAKALVSEQNALWREYQQAQGVDQPASALDTEDESEYGSGIRSSRDTDARLSIVSAGSGAAAGETKDPTEMTAEELREQLALAREQLETERVTKEGLQGDVGELEQKIEKMQSLLQIEDDSMAEIQAVAEGERAPVGDEVAELEEAVTEEVDSEEAALAALDELTGETEQAVEEEAAVTEEAVTEGEEVFIDEQAELEQVVEEEIEVEVAEPAPVDIAPRKQPGLVASLLGNPLVTGGVALLVLVLLAVGYILVKRRRDMAGADAEATLAADLEQGLDSGLEDVADSVEDDLLDDFAAEEEIEEPIAEAEAEAEAEDESFESEATMILPSTEDTVVTPAATAAAPEEEEERDDVIAEADVYLAYGIYQQAEELLQNAINDNPDKDSYSVKLAETYFAGKNAEGLEKLGTEMNAKLGGEDTPAWQKVAAMGKELCPEAKVFQQAGAVADLDIDDLKPKSPEPMDFDLGDESAAEETPDLDLDFDAPMEESAELEMPVDETIAIPSSDAPAAEESVEELSAGELEFDIGETEAVAEEPEAAAEEEFSLDIEASELDLEVVEETPADEEDSVEIDSSELDFDMGEDLAESPEAEESAEADISLDADLDFSMDTDEPSAEEPAAAPVAEASDELDLSDLGDVDEINTKLDLAKAYMDMGDHEGARDILDEVVAGGNSQQKQEAQELLGQLG
jgi:pilus assembly protein FimV